MPRISKPLKEVRWDSKYLYLRTNGTERRLGRIRTNIGKLSRDTKLRAVDAQGEWVPV